MKTLNPIEKDIKHITDMSLSELSLCVPCKGDIEVLDLGEGITVQHIGVYTCLYYILEGKHKGAVYTRVDNKEMGMMDIPLPPDINEWTGSHIARILNLIWQTIANDYYETTSQFPRALFARAVTTHSVMPHDYVPRTEGIRYNKQYIRIANALFRVFKDYISVPRETWIGSTVNYLQAKYHDTPIPLSIYGTLDVYALGNRIESLEGLSLLIKGDDTGFIDFTLGSLSLPDAPYIFGGMEYEDPIVERIIQTLTTDSQDDDMIRVYRKGTYLKNDKYRLSTRYAKTMLPCITVIQFTRGPDREVVFINEHTDVCQRFKLEEKDTEYDVTKLFLDVIGNNTISYHTFI